MTNGFVMRAVFKRIRAHRKGKARVYFFVGPHAILRIHQFLDEHNFDCYTNDRLAKMGYWSVMVCGCWAILDPKYETKVEIKKGRLL